MKLSKKEKEYYQQEYEHMLKILGSEAEVWKSLQSDKGTGKIS